MLDKVQSIVREYEEEILFDVEAPAHWYEIEFYKDRIIIYEVNEYDFGEERRSEIERIPCTLKQFTNFVIQFYQTQILYMRNSYPQEAYVLEKIIIKGIRYNEVIK